MKTQRTDRTITVAHISVSLAVASLVVFAVAMFVPVDLTPFHAEEGLLVIGPFLALSALLAAACAWFRTGQRTRWRRVALLTAGTALLLSGGFTGLLILAYSHCPGGLC